MSEQGSVVFVTATSYERRRFTVVDGTPNRLELRGARGAHRILVVTSEGHGWIYEDDGERNRGRPCTFELDEPARPGASQDPRIPQDGDADIIRREAAEQSAEWRERGWTRGKACPTPDTRAGQGIRVTQDELAALIRCETAEQLAGWVLDRAVSKACCTDDPHAEATVAALKIWQSARRLIGGDW